MRTSRAWKYAVMSLFASCFAISTLTQPQQTRPNGLPPWAYNIPDKDQPPATPLTGTVHVPGSTKDTARRKPAATRPLPTGSPMNMARLQKL